MFTQGKWVVSSSTIVCNEQAKIIANCTPFVDVPELSIPLKESMNNARLIAAAPDMYALLKEFCDWHETNATWDKNGRTYYKAKELLSKIEGD